MKPALIKIAFLILLFPFQNLKAWDHGGHMCVAAIAYTNLKTHNPTLIPKIVSILKKHPDYTSEWKAHIDASGSDKDLVLFMLAARWPDDIKSWYAKNNAGEIHRPWHYVNLPISFDGTKGPQPKEGDQDIYQAFKTHLDVLGSSATDEKKAIALCWVFHLLGDVHQPLHNVALFSKTFLKGDKGGNNFTLLGTPNELHAFWDDTFLPNGSNIANLDGQWLAKVKTAYNDAMNNNKVTYDPNYSFDYKKVSNDGKALAQNSVYQFSGKKLVPDNAVPAGYKDAVRKISSKQIVLAGTRLAEVLSQKVKK
ncbi:MAG TPA: S1/P1 nuclease [Cyclobacteriaceae bacterium]|jgi:hypothetical protein|nr:S1/P1 nuclease [Cyclobacteriaceae bacterium]